MSWIPIDCAESDRLRSDLVCIASHTCMAGCEIHFDPYIETVWGTRDETPVVKNIRHPRRDSDVGVGDRKPCEHWRWEGPQ